MDNIRDFVHRGGIPITTSILAVNVITFLAAFMFPAVLMSLGIYAAYTPRLILVHPWTIVSYSLVYLDTSGPGFFNFLFGGFFFWYSGGSLERSWGSSRFAKFFFTLSAISAVSLWIGFLLIHDEVELFSFFLPMAALIVAFCAIRMEDTVSWFFFPMKAKYLALIATIGAWVSMGQGGHALIGFFGLGGILAAYLYVTYGRSWERPQAASRFGGDSKILRMDHPKFQTKSSAYLDGSPRERSVFDVIGRWRAWQERKRLEQLLKNSGFSDREPDWRDDDGGRRRP